MTPETANFKDHFSGHSSLYAKARPLYPDALFAWLAAEAPARGCVWDAGCGNGQASVALARYFERVVATDPSERQIGQAVPDPRVEYRAEPAEHTSLERRSSDAVTVAQALHWFDLDAFVAEVRRVCKAGALFAAWSYANCSVTPAVDAIVEELYDSVLGPYWPPERKLVDEGYASLVLPFVPIAAPAFEMRVDWNAAQFLAYLSSWSAAQRYRAAIGGDAVPGLRTGCAPRGAIPPSRGPCAGRLRFALPASGRSERARDYYDMASNHPCCWAPARPSFRSLSRARCPDIA